MLKSAKFKNFTTVPNEEFRFGAGLNVIVGANGLGKSHILKAIYTLLKVQSTKNVELTKSSLEKAYADKLVGVMRPEALGRLVKRKHGRDRCELALDMKETKQCATIAFASSAKSQVEVTRAPTEALPLSPVYLPTRELATLCPWFVPLYDNYHLEFEETWRDTVSLLGAPSVKGPREKAVAKLLAPLEEAMNGRVIVDSKTGRFYLSVSGGGQMEMPLVAEGVRKLAMLARLISTGVLLEQGYLFWDEPETNLNPKLIRTVAASIIHLANHGIQVFIATHSLFLLRELEILRAAPGSKKIDTRFFGLRSDDGTVTVSQGPKLEDIGSITALDESLMQSDRYLDLD
ncbi:MAG: ATP-binding protein [Massilia sp.]|nr:ATP-binding protein [Massilia sp.]MDB5790682.1 ATP-binding protein [Massilia sp.]